MAITEAQMQTHSHVHKQAASTAGGSLSTFANNYLATYMSGGKAVNMYNSSSDAAMDRDSTLATGGNFFRYEVPSGASATSPAMGIGMNPSPTGGA